MGNLYVRAYGGSQYDAGLAIAPLSDGGFIVAGQTYSFGAGDYDICLLKLRPDGTSDWIRTFGGTGWEAAEAIIPTSDGNFLVVGGTTSWGAGSQDILVFKITPSGSVSWARVYGGTGIEMAYGAIQTSDGGYAVAGYTSSVGGGEDDLLLLKLGTDGAVTWGARFGGSLEEVGFGVLQTSDGGYVVVGEREISGTDRDALVVKFTSGGGFSWARSLGGSYPERGVSVHRGLGDSIVVGGFTLSAGTGYYKFMLFKMGSTGSLGPVMAYGGGNSDYCYEMIPAGDGGFILAGETRSSGAGTFDFAFMKVNSAGVLQWARTWGTISTDDGWAVAKGADGGFGLTGWTYGVGANGDIIILKTDASGNYPGCVSPWSPSTYSPAFTTTTLSGSGTWTPTSSNRTLTVGTPTWTPLNPCPPIGVSEHILPDEIRCLPARGGLVFWADKEFNLLIYLPDGRLAHSESLRAGENRIRLEPGVYLWKAGPYEGKAIAR